MSHFSIVHNSPQKADRSYLKHPLIRPTNSQTTLRGQSQGSAGGNGFQFAGKPHKILPMTNQVALAGMHLICSRYLGGIYQYCFFRLGCRAYCVCNIPNIPQGRALPAELAITIKLVDLIMRTCGLKIHVMKVVVPACLCMASISGLARSTTLALSSGLQPKALATCHLLNFVHWNQLRQRRCFIAEKVHKCTLLYSLYHHNLEWVLEIQEYS